MNLRLLCVVVMPDWLAGGYRIDCLSSILQKESRTELEVKLNESRSQIVVSFMVLSFNCSLILSLRVALNYNRLKKV